MACTFSLNEIWGSSYRKTTTKTIIVDTTWVPDLDSIYGALQACWLCDLCEYYFVFHRITLFGLCDLWLCWVFVRELNDVRWMRWIGEYLYLVGLSRFDVWNQACFNRQFLQRERLSVVLAESICKLSWIFINWYIRSFCKPFVRAGFIDRLFFGWNVC